MAAQDIREFTFLQIGDNGLYDLFLTTNTGIDIPLQVFVCDRQHAMKMYKVSYDLYGTTAYTGFLCLINDILNPFSINIGDVLVWAEQSFADQLVDVPPADLAAARQVAINNLFNINKTPQPDPNRSTFLGRTPDPLPPNVLPNAAPQIVVDNNKLKLTPNLFNNPNSNISQAPPTPPSTLADVVPQPVDDIQKVLVARYVKNL
jgi:hypothetical protein